MLLTAVAAALLGAAWYSDLGNTLPDLRFTSEWMGPPPSWRDYLPPVFGAVTAVAALAVLPPAVPARPTWIVAAVITVGSIVVSTVLGAGPPGQFFGYPVATTEVLALALLANLVVLRGSPGALVCTAGGLLVAYLSIELRRATVGDDPQNWVVPLGFGVAALAPGFYLRWRASQHAWRIDQARREERLLLARDLHDAAAHHITGIVVQVQALRHVAAARPDLAVAALPAIEEASGDALTAMRRIVATLREDDGSGHEASPPGVALHALSAPGSEFEARVDVRVEGDPDRLPVEIADAVLRIAQESVTNARRHARDATRIEVLVRVACDGVELSVRDNGRGGASAAGRRRGYGLTGMAERAKILDGDFTAGPVPDGPGWRVDARFPV
ncbi:hypothetical protein Nans01_29250 [Nocardiopsis ansamitocini]|uniref:histidine kinase n=1 Tax=Nocardiopsis ansamitocini TaxID=1670832 RepID=A0A9W6UJ89_9ACTN|nr:hypothetical protein Nans01_29250 [Nocardiopsis ansamitocini]